MPKFRNSDYAPNKWQPVNKPLSAEGFLLFILSDIGNSSDFRSNILGAISTLAHEETWDYDTDISSAYAALEVFFVDFCEKVRDCILNNQTVKDAILTTVIDSGYYPSNAIVPLNTGQGAENLLEGLSCSENDIKGYAKSIAEYCHGVALDAIEIFASETTQSMFGARVIDMIPLVGDIPVIDDFADFADWLQNVFLVQYNAGWTETLLDEIICAIYLKACATCELTPFDVASAYASIGAFPLAFGMDFGGVIDIMKGVTEDRQVVLGFHLVVISAMASGSKVLGYIGAKGLKQVIANSEPYVLETCDDCPNFGELLVTFDYGGYPNYTYEFVSLTDHAIVGSLATHTSGNCLIVSRLAAQQVANSQIELTVNMPQIVTITGCTIDVSGYRSDGVSNGALQAYLTLYDASDNLMGSASIIVNPVTVPDVFQEIDFGVLSVANVSYALLVVGVTTGFIAHGTRTRLDNIHLTYTT